MGTIQGPPSRLQLKAVDENKGTIEGYASLFNIEDSEADVVAPGAFATSLKEWENSRHALPLLWQHDRAQPIGVWTFMKEDATGLFVRGRLFINDVAKAKEAYALVKNGALSGLSIGYRPEQAIRDTKRGVRILERVKLFEISLVTFPACNEARISAVKGARGGEGEGEELASLVASLQSFNNWLEEATPSARL